MDNGRKLLVYTSHPGTEKQENLSVLLLDIESHNIHTTSLLFSSMNEPSAPRHLSYIKASLLVIKLFQVKLLKTTKTDCPKLVFN